MRLNELEVKIAVDSEDKFKQVFDTCTRLYGPPSSHVLQLDEYFDTPDRQLKKQDLVIRIRSINNKKAISLKSPRMTLPSGMSERIELEFLSADEENVQEQLDKQGLRPYEAAEKERWTFVSGDSEIVLDKLPFIGTFVEVEGSSEEAIQKIVEMLDLSSYPVISKNYGELMIEKFRELHLPLSNIYATFAKESEFYA